VADVWVDSHVAHKPTPAARVTMLSAIATIHPLTTPELRLLAWPVWSLAPLVTRVHVPWSSMFRAPGDRPVR
jgi:hypothetical protein